MPSRFTRRVLRVIRNDQETKRVIQTKQNCQVYGEARAREKFEESQINQAPTAGGVEDGDLWWITHNRIQVWPCKLLYSVPGYFGGGYITNAQAVALNPGVEAEQSRVRIGDEIWCKGISLKIQCRLAKEAPFCKLEMMLVRSQKGDHPRPDGVDGSKDDPKASDSNFYMGYSQNKALDMINTSRHKIIKKWTRKIYQNQPTTFGKEVTAEGFDAYDMNTTAVTSELVVLKDAGGLTISQWLAKIEAEYPDYAVYAPDQYNDSHDLSELDASLATLMCERPYQDLAAMAEAGVAVKYYIYEDSAVGVNERYTWAQMNQYMADTLRGSSGPLYPGATNKAYQVVLHRKLGAPTGPSDDQIMISGNKILSYWIPGYLFGYGGNLRYNNSTLDNDHELYGVYEYNLLFFTRTSYKT